MDQAPVFSIEELLTRPVLEVTQILETLERHLFDVTMSVLLKRGDAAVASFSSERRSLVDHLSILCMRLVRGEGLEARIKFLIDCGFYYNRIGQSPIGTTRAEAARALAYEHGFPNLERRACGVLAGTLMDMGDLETACQRVERAVVLARELGEPFLVANALGQVTLLFKEMGLYREAMDVADRVLMFELQTPEGQHVIFSAAGNALFCAHRLRDDARALRYLSAGSACLESPAIDGPSRATFDYYRVLHLLDHRDFETADLLIEAAVAKLGALQNPRIDILMKLCAALCDWASQNALRRTRSKQVLRELYAQTRQTRLYFDDVLRTLSHVCSVTSDGAEMEEGIAYATELVGYVTSVKRAKFYRQLNERGVETAGLALGGEPDVLAPAKRWLGGSSALAGEELVVAAGQIERHGELSAIHDDLASLRTSAFKASVRTVAYDVAENWALAAEFFDDETGQHCFRVGYLARMLAREICQSEEFCERIELAARLHDIGKIGVNELILLKPGPLDPAELSAVRAHAEVGAFMLEGVTDPTLQMAAVIAKYHHEWWNGTGYPRRLSGQEIPLEARICALADVYDALTNRRAYKAAWSHRMAIEQMANETPSHFDPSLISPFLRVLEKYLAIKDSSEFQRAQRSVMHHNGLIDSRRRLVEAVKGSG